MAFSSPNVATHLSPSQMKAMTGLVPTKTVQRAGSGNHHQRHAAPRKELYHLLSLAVANFEVNKREEASNHARQLVELLHSKGIIL
jgi:hypothetical protein